MQRVELEVQPRDLGGKSKATNMNQLRNEGFVPGTLYGNGKSTSFAVDMKTLGKALHNKAGANALFNVKFGGETSLAVIKEIQRHILKHTPIHIDFQRIDMKKKLEMSVSVHVLGTSTGVKNSGGILEHITREIRVRCLPDHIPASIDVDVTNLELGHGIKVKELPAIEGVEYMTLGDTIVVNVVAPKVEEVAAPAATAAGAAATPEVIAKGKEKEGAAAGAAPAAGAAAAKGAAPAAKDEKKK
jgi:large subunit ribosomal protein L25